MVVEVVPYAEAGVAVVDYDMTDNYLSPDDVFHYMSCHACLPLHKSLSFRILVMFVALSMSLPLEFYLAIIDHDHQYLHHQATAISHLRRLTTILSHLISSYKFYLTSSFRLQFSFAFSEANTCYTWLLSPVVVSSFIITVVSTLAIIFF